MTVGPGHAHAGARPRARGAATRPDVPRALTGLLRVGRQDAAVLRLGGLPGRGPEPGRRRRALTGRAAAPGDDPALAPRREGRGGGGRRDDRTFVLAEQPARSTAMRVAPVPRVGSLYLLRLGSAARVSSLPGCGSRWRQRRGRAFALSPDGQRLAIAVAPGEAPRPGPIPGGHAEPGRPHLGRHGGIISGAAYSRRSCPGPRAGSWRSTGNRKRRPEPAVASGCSIPAAAGGGLLAASRRVVSRPASSRDGETRCPGASEHDPLPRTGRRSSVQRGVLPGQDQRRARHYERPVRLRRVLRQDREAHPDHAGTGPRSRRDLCTTALVRALGAGLIGSVHRRPDSG